MLKDLKEKIKNISEIVGMISIMGTLMVAITAALYNFGFFSYFSINIWKLPVTISEIITDVIVILPKLLLILVVCSILLFTGSIILFFITESYDFIINIICTSKKYNINKIKYKIIKYIKGYSLLTFIIISFLHFLSILICIIWKNKPDAFNPCVIFSVWRFCFITFNFIKKIKLSIYWILFFLLMYFMTMIASGIYDANVEDGKEYFDTIVKVDGSIVDNIKILKVYDTGIVVMPLTNKLDFFYSSDIKKYSIQTEKNNIFGDDIILNTSNNESKLLYKLINLVYRYIKVLISYNIKKVKNYIYDYSTYCADKTLIQKGTSNIINFLYNKI